MTLKHYRLNKRGKIQLILFIFLLFIFSLYKVYKCIPDKYIVYETYALNNITAKPIIENITCEEVLDLYIIEETSYEEPIPSYDSETVEVLTNLLYGEARGIKSDMEKSAVIWCVLNRYDNGHYGKTIIAVATAKNQFVGYVKNRTYDDIDSYNHCKEIVIDVLDRYYGNQEGRTLPADYLYFVAKNGHNVFTRKWKSTNYWDWSLPNPYTI